MYFPIILVVNLVMFIMQISEILATPQGKS